MKLKPPQKCCVPGLALILVLMFSSFTTPSLQAQKTITGTVVDQDDLPIPGVNVIQKGTSKGAATDFDGNFSIVLEPGVTTLILSYIGYETQEILIGDRTTLPVVLEEDAESLEEVVVIGYAPIERNKVLGSISTVKSEAIEQATPVQAFDAVQGRLAGVQILTNNGPGAGFDIRVRGVSTFGSGTSPLFVVDGQQLEDIDNLDPSDIASLEVLKDGATAAIYGSKAANGVVIITTKSGKSGQLRLDVTTITGVNSLVGEIPASNTAQRILYENVRNSDPDFVTGNQRDSLSLLSRNSPDFQDLLFRTSYRHQTNVSLSGGGEKAKFYWNSGFLNEDGVIINSNYRRINTQLKVDVDGTKALTAGSRINLSFEEQNGGNTDSYLPVVAARIPIFPLFEPNGDFTPTLFGQGNPIARATLRTETTRNFRAQIFNYAQLRLAPRLTVKSTLGINFRMIKLNLFNPRLIVGNFARGNPNGRERNDLRYDIQQENFLNYKNKFGKHDFAAFGGMQIQKFFRENSEFSSNEFISDDIRTFNNTSPGTILTNSFDQRNNIFSLFGGVNYDYDNRYLVGATIRRDGSSRFGDENEFGYFPSATLGWRTSNESFLRESGLINNLLFRASWGIVGNERIGNYEFTGALEPGFVYNGISGVAPTRLGNPQIGWEETESINLGFDLAMFKNRLEINFDLWEKKTTDLLAITPLPEETGFGGIRRNVGAVDNRGIDFNISGTILKSKNFTWRSNFNIGLLENEVVALDGGTPFESGRFRIEEGEPIGNIFGYKNLGIFPFDESNAFTPDGDQLTPNFDNAGTFSNYTLNGAEYTGEVNQLRAANQTLQGGDVFWEDIDGNFVIDASDRQIIGNGLATIYGGFSHDIQYKNFSVSTLFDYSLGQDIYRRYDENRNSLRFANQTPSPNYILESWRQQGDISEYPRLSRVPQQRLRPNSFYVTDGDYIKWRYVRFNYSFPKKAMDKIPGVKAASLNLAVNNVLTWTNYIGYNPELGNRGNALQPNEDNLRYPNDREIIMGLRVSF